MEGSPIPTEDLVPRYAHWKNTHSKWLAIVGSAYSWASIAASLSVIWMMRRSRVGLSSTFHRILLGICVSAISVSLGSAHFNYLSPSDVDYVVWNARGNALTCDVSGAFGGAGVVGHLLFLFSLSVHALVAVKFDKSGEYIRSRVEPWLLGIPAVSAALITTVGVLLETCNDSLSGNCHSAVFKPPHCIGLQKYEIREGFEIPCFRGSNALIMETVLDTTIGLVIPVANFVCLGMVYAAVRQLEREQVGYNDDNGNTTSQIQLSRTVGDRALAYSSAYLVFWAAIICLQYPESFTPEGEPRPLWVGYLDILFTPFPGIWNFIIFMRPRVKYARRSNDCSWRDAILIAFRLRGPPRTSMMLDAEIAIDSDVPVSETELSDSVSPPILPAEEDSTGVPDIGGSDPPGVAEELTVIEQDVASLPLPQESHRSSVSLNSLSATVQFDSQSLDTINVHHEEHSEAHEGGFGHPPERPELEAQHETIVIGPTACGVPLAKSVTDCDNSENDSDSDSTINNVGAGGDVHNPDLSLENGHLYLRRACLERGIAISTFERYLTPQSRDELDPSTISRVSQLMSSLGFIYNEDHQIV